MPLPCVVMVSSASFEVHVLERSRMLHEFPQYVITYKTSPCSPNATNPMYKVVSHLYIKHIWPDAISIYYTATGRGFDNWSKDKALADLHTRRVHVSRRLGHHDDVNDKLRTRKNLYRIRIAHSNRVNSKCSPRWVAKIKSPAWLSHMLINRTWQSSTKVKVIWLQPSMI